MSKTKILYTIPNFRTAGSQYVLLSLFRNVDRTVFDPYICVENSIEVFPEEIPTECRLMFQWTGNKLQDLFGFKSLIKKYNIDIVHSWDYKSHYFEPLAAQIARVPYLYTKKNSGWSRRWKLKSLLSSHIAYDNPEMKDRFFNDSIFQKKITFIPHGVDVDVFKPLKKVPRTTFNIACIGNITTNKNQLFIIEALMALPKDVHLYFYGNEDDSYRKKIDEYLIANSLSDRVFIKSFVANVDIPQVYKNIDLFVLASFREGLPVSILEAMACGVPALSSDSGGGAKFLLPPEFIFSLENTKDLTDKILWFYNMSDDGKQNIKNSGRARVCNQHSVQKEVSDYERLYKKLIGN